MEFVHIHATHIAPARNNMHTHDAVCVRACPKPSSPSYLCTTYWRESRAQFSSIIKTYFPITCAHEHAMMYAYAARILWACGAPLVRQAFHCTVLYCCDILGTGVHGQFYLQQRRKMQRGVVFGIAFSKRVARFNGGGVYCISTIFRQRCLPRNSSIFAVYSSLCLFTMHTYFHKYR